HEPLVDRLAMRLEDEDVGAAKALGVARVDLAVREGAKLRLDELGLERLSDLLRQLGVRASAHQDQALDGLDFDRGHRLPLPSRPVTQSTESRAAHSSRSADRHEAVERIPELRGETAVRGDRRA